MTTTENEEDLELCKICRVPRDAHGNRIHPFTSPSGEVDASFIRPPRQEPGRSNLPFDPVVRQALLDKGILTPADIAEAEVRVNMIVSGQITVGGADGAGSGPTPR